MTKKLLLTLLIGTSLLSLDLAQIEATGSLSKKLLNQDSPELVEASRLSQQVVKLYNEKKHDEAMPLAKRALELREKALGKEHPLVVAALNNLAQVYTAKGKYADAESLYERALAAQEKAHGADSPRVAEALENLAWVRYGRGKVEEATEMFERALSIREKALGPLHADTSHSLFNLARLHEKMGSPEKSLPFYRRALEIREKALGPNHKQVGELLDKYACALRQARRDSEADEIEKRAYAILRGDEPGTGKISTVTGGVLKGSAIERVRPQYPQAARQARMTGTIVIEVIVDESGNVIDARAKCGPDIFAHASIEAARKWRFTPTTLHGQSVKVMGTITFNFVP
ncbi:MAG TPA: TonB family protein [Blastocatellia bacterium]|nr:TonB family protein [Blastocatellia bacterium]